MNNKIKKDFSQIPNNLINDYSISRDARFLFVYLCSKPDSWKFHTTVVERDLNFGKNTRVKYMKELIEKGWISTIQVKNNDGSFGSVEINLNAYPNTKNHDAEPCTKNTAAVKHRGGKIGMHNNTDLLSNTNINNNTDVKFNFKNSFLELGATEELLNDWLKVRIKKKASNTETAFKLLKTQIELSNIHVDEILIICIEKDWKGFKSEWINNLTQNNYGKERITDTRQFKQIVEAITSDGIRR